MSFKKIITFPFLLPIYFYKYLISPLLPAGCRHYPTCSSYALDALKIHGPITGILLAANRILRCNPWGTHGFDPVPRMLFRKVRLGRYGLSSTKKHPSCDRLKH